MKITSGIVDTPTLSPIVDEISPIVSTPLDIPGTANSEQQQKKSFYLLVG